MVAVVAAVAEAGEFWVDADAGGAAELVAEEEGDEVTGEPLLLLLDLKPKTRPSVRAVAAASAARTPMAMIHLVRLELLVAAFFTGAALAAGRPAAGAATGGLDGCGGGGGVVEVGL